jgi:hypothetical protein
VKAKRESGGFVEITLRADVYEHLRETLRRYANGQERWDDFVWIARFLADLDRKDAEDLGVN